MTELDEQIPREPPIAGTEAEALIGALERQRRIFAWKCGGLDAEGLATRIAASTMTLGGLLKHMALVEDSHFARLWLDEKTVGPWSAWDYNSDPDWEWNTAAEDSPEQLMTLWRDAVARSRALLRDALADGGPEQAGKYVNRSGESPNLRRIILDMIEEYARHIGHADLIREAVDGLVGEDEPEE
jgi:uncharacterized damage-inducible protein DinB